MLFLPCDGYPQQMSVEEAGKGLTVARLYAYNLFGVQKFATAKVYMGSRSVLEVSGRL